MTIKCPICKMEAEEPEGLESGIDYLRSHLDIHHGDSQQTPAEDVRSRLSVPLGCGYKGCQDVVFGVQPLPTSTLNPFTGLNPMQEWENIIQAHQQGAGHRRHKLREVPNEGKGGLGLPQ